MNFYIFLLCMKIMPQRLISSFKVKYSAESLNPHTSRLLCAFTYSIFYSLDFLLYCLRYTQIFYVFLLLFFLLLFPFYKKSIFASVTIAHRQRYNIIRNANGSGTLKIITKKIKSWAWAGNYQFLCIQIMYYYETRHIVFDIYLNIFI